MISLIYVDKSTVKLTICRVECSLTVESVYNHTENNVTSVDKYLGKHQSFPEVVADAEIFSTRAYVRRNGVVLTVGASPPSAH